MTARRFIANVLRNLCDRMDPPRRPTVHVSVDIEPDRLAEIARAVERENSRANMTHRGMY